MAHHTQNLDWKFWLEENKRRVIFQNHMYLCAGRDHPDHPMHGLFTGLWNDFCFNEAGPAQRNTWFDRMQFVQDVADGKVKLEEQEPN